MKYLDMFVFGLVDLVESIGVAASIILVKPFMMVSRIDKWIGGWRRISALLPRGLLALVWRAELEKLLGNNDEVAAILIGVINTLEEEHRFDKENKTVTDLLTIFYTELVKAFLVAGRLDDASSMLVRAHGILGGGHLPDLPRLDIRTAHIIKAGIAASRLLEEGGGFATLTVDRNQTGPAKKELPSFAGNTTVPGGQEPVPPLPHLGAKVLPFPHIMRT